MRLVLAGGSGQITIDSHDKRYCIAFDRGTIVGASSPVSADSAARVALTSHAITPAHLAEVGRRLTAAPDRDEIELVCEVGGLSVDHAEALRKRVIAQRAARTFGLDSGSWATTDRIRIPIVRGISVDARGVVYLGARSFMTDERLSADLRRMGTHFTLKPEALDDLPAYGFGDLERPVIRALRAGASLPELEANHRELDPRALQAILYTLATCDGLTCVTVAHTPSPANVLFKPRTQSSDVPILARTLSPQTPSRQPVLARTLSPQQPRQALDAPHTVTGPMPAVGRTPTPQRPIVARTKSPQGPAVARTKSPTLPISARVPTGTTIPPVSTGTAVARVATGKRAPTAPITGRAPARGRVITPPRGHVIVDPARPAAVDPVQTTRLANEAFHRGERLLANDQLDAAIPELQRAVQLAPDDVDYAAALAWAKFCRASDKQHAAIDARPVLDRAVYKSKRPATALFWLGRMERIVGRDQHALRHFQEVLALQPTNETVASEIRVLEARIARDSRR